MSSTLLIHKDDVIDVDEVSGYAHHAMTRMTLGSENVASYK